MAGSPGMDAIRAALAKKRNAGGKVASALSNSKGRQNSSSGGSGQANAIARRLAKGKVPSDNDGDEHDYR